MYQKIHYRKHKAYHMMKRHIYGKTVAGRRTVLKYENSIHGKLTRRLWTISTLRWKQPKRIEYMKQYHKKHDKLYRLRKKIFNTLNTKKNKNGRRLH